MNNPFILYLASNKDVPSIKNPLDVMVQLSDFQKNFLLPALESTTNLKEFLSLESLVDQCTALSKKLMENKMLGDARNSVKNENQSLIAIWDAKQVQMQLIYQKLLTYEKGQIGSLFNEEIRRQRLEKIVVLVKEFAVNINHPIFTRDEKMAILNAVKIIEAEFAEYGVAAKLPIAKLEEAIGIAKNTPFSLLLDELLISKEISAEHKKALFFFLKDDLLVRVKEMKSRNELQALAPLIEKCAKLAEKIENEKIDKQLIFVLELVQKKEKEFAAPRQVVVPAPASQRVGSGRPTPQNSAPVARAVVEAKPPVLQRPVRPISTRGRDTIQTLAQEIVGLKPTIGDANGYWFSSSYGTYINDLNTKKGSLAMLAAGLNAHARRTKYHESPELILQMGRDLLKDRSGQCDHMAAAVIAKIVEHIQNGGQWDSDVELMGNGGHSFIIINRPQEETKNLDNWNGAIVVDTWLDVVGVHKNHQNKIPSPKKGIISDPREVRRFASAFKAEEGAVKVLTRFSAQELRALAQSQPKVRT